MNSMVLDGDNVTLYTYPGKCSVPAVRGQVARWSTVTGCGSVDKVRMRSMERKPQSHMIILSHPSFSFIYLDFLS